MAERCGDGGDGQAEATAPRLLRAIVAATSPVVCEGVCTILGNSPVEVACRVGSLAEAAERAGDLAPDLLIVEAQALAGTVAPAFEALRTAQPQLAIIVLSLFGGALSIGPALAGGVSAYLCRDVGRQSLLLAIEAALQRHVLFDRAAFLELCDALAAPPAADPRDLVAMSPREWEVLALMARGLSYRDIAADLCVAVGTVRTHACRILKKLCVPDRASAAVWATQHGLGGDPCAAC